jgi:hypothetical protein
VAKRGWEILIEVDRGLSVSVRGEMGHVEAG